MCKQVIFDADGLPIALTAGLHFVATLDAAGAVTVTRIAFPFISADAPVTVYIERVAPATQGVDFDNLAAYDASVHERLPMPRRCAMPSCAVVRPAR